MRDIQWETGKPKCPGLYVAYIDSLYNIPFASKVLLVWDGNVWGYPSSPENYRDEVYGFIGPLPAMRLGHE